MINKYRIVLNGPRYTKVREMRRDPESEGKRDKETAKAERDIQREMDLDRRTKRDRE